MKQIIKGCMYDIEKSTYLATQYIQQRSIKEFLYITQKGAFFLHHENTKLGTLILDKTTSYLKALSEKEVYEWLDNTSLTSKELARLEKYITFEDA